MKLCELEAERIDQLLRSLDDLLDHRRRLVEGTIARKPGDIAAVDHELSMRVLDACRDPEPEGKP